MIVAQARTALGARFRLHGRDPASGLDCLGLVAFALGVDAVPSGYLLGSGDVRDVDAIAERLGLGRVEDARAGDVLLLRAGPAQLHLAIDSGGGIIHADAGLRRVSERPGVPPWPVLARWRLQGE